MNTNILAVLLVTASTLPVPGRLVTVAPPVPPRADSVLTLAEAMQRAAQHYPTVASSEANLTAAQAGIRRERAEWWPRLSVIGSGTQYQKPMIVNPIHDFQPGETPPFDETLIQGGANLSWTLLDAGGSRRARIDRSKSEAGAAASALSATRQSLLSDVASAYLDALGLQELRTAHDRRIAALEAELKRVRQRFEVGRAARLEILRVEAELAGADAERVAVNARLEVARRELARLTGLSPASVESRGLTPLRLRDSSVPNRETLAARARARSPVVQRARRVRRAAEASVAVARGQRWPDLELAGSWVDRGSADGDFESEWSVGLQLSLPVYSGGRIGSEVTRAEAERRRAGEELRVAEKTIERAVDRAASRVDETLARIRSLERATSRSEEVVRIERLRLDEGRGIQTDYLDAEASLLAVRARLVEARHATIRARVELARAVGTLDPGWMERNVETRREGDEADGT